MARDDRGMTFFHVVRRMDVRSAMRRYWMPLGLLVFLTIPFWASTRNALKTEVYLFALLPALFLLLDVGAVRRALSGNRLFPLFCILIGYLLISAAWLPVPDIHYVREMVYAFLLVYGLGCQLDISEKSLIRLLLAGIAFCVLGAVISLMLMSDPDARVVAQGRLIGYGPLINPLLSGNLYGCYLVLLIGISAAACRRWWQWLLAVAAGVAIFGFIIRTGSRSPLLALAIAATVVLWKQGHRRAFHVWLGTAVSMIATAVLFWPELAERGLSLRPEIWEKVVELCLQHPWFGRGLGAEIEIEANGITWLETHNLILSLWYSSGVPAVLLWLAFNALLIRELWLRAGDIAAIVLGLLVYGMVTMVFVGTGLPSTPNEFWYQIWLPMALGIWVTIRVPRAAESAIRMETPAPPLAELSLESELSARK